MTDHCNRSTMGVKPWSGVVAQGGGKEPGSSDRGFAGPEDNFTVQRASD